MGQISVEIPGGFSGKERCRRLGLKSCVFQHVSNYLPYVVIVLENMY
jgi:hypothetical protein